MEVVIFIAKGVGIVVLSIAVLGHRRWTRQLRISNYSRGRQLEKPKRNRGASTLSSGSAIRFGNDYLPESAATGHFLAAGTSGSGKSLVQRLLLESMLKNIWPGSDRRMLIFDAKGETTAYLNRIGVSAPIYSLNPFESRSENPIAVAWDIGKDITSPTRANNLSHSLIKGESSGTNGYFTKAARIVVAACMRSFIKHSGSDWVFSDLINATTSWERMKEVLERDAMGQQIAETFLGDNNTGYGVATTVVADMELYSPIAALWQRSSKRLSIRDWLKGDSIVLLGENETASATLDVLNEQIFTVFVEEVLMQSNSSAKRTGLWIDEAQEAGCILRSGKLQSFAAKARSRGGVLLLAFQDIEGFRVAAGDPKVADSIIAQCNYKALLRQESFESAEWASKLVGQFETIEVFRSESKDWHKGDPGSEQRVVRDAVLPSEFYSIAETNPENGLTGYFISSRLGARRMTIPSQDIAKIAVNDREEIQHAIVYRPETDQWLRDWTFNDKARLALNRQQQQVGERNVEQEQEKKTKLQLQARRTLEALQHPKANC